MKNFLRNYWFALMVTVWGVIAISAIIMDKPNKPMEYSYLPTLPRFTVGPAYIPCDYTIYPDHHTETDCDKKEDVITNTMASSTIPLLPQKEVATTTIEMGELSIKIEYIFTYREGCKKFSIPVEINNGVMTIYQSEITINKEEDLECLKFKMGKELLNNK